MKPYPSKILDVWDSDSKPGQIPSDSESKTYFPQFYENLSGEFKWFRSSIKGIEQNEDGDVFDRLYRRCHIVYGFTTYLRIPKVAHLLAILDFSFDCARSIQTLEKYKLKYLIDLLIDTTENIMNEYTKGGSSEIDIHDMVEECAAYLREPLELTAVVEKAPSVEPVHEEADSLETVDSAESEHLPSHPEAEDRDEATAVEVNRIIGEIPFDDEPEPLDIPVDKVGLISDFCEECRENLTQIGNQAIELEYSDAPIQVVHDIFRSIHTIKGGARLLKIRNIFVHCQSE